MDALPLALPGEPVRISPAETPREGARRLGEDCERLSRAAFETLRGRSGHRLSGSDIQDLSKWLALGHFLSGRLLLHAAQQSPEAGALREAAAALRTAAVAWQQASAAWHRVVDLADPRHHPALPKASYRLRHLGRVVELPRVDPHPAVVTAWQSALRVGRLLYGPEWAAERREPAMRPRPVEDVLTDCGGPGALAAALHRLPATGWQLALAAPRAVQRARKGLVTDDRDGRPVVWRVSAGLLGRWKRRPCGR